MKKALKILLWLTGAAAALLAAAALFLVLTFDANRYKAEIVSAVRGVTGRDLTIDGDLSLSFFPWLGVEIGAMQLSNAAGFGPEPFAKIGGAAVKVKLLPLLKKEVEVNTVTLDGLYLLLRRDAAGRNNWDDLTARSKEEKTTEDASAAPALASLAVGGLNLRDATLIWDDQAAPARYDFSKLNLRSGPISLTDPVRLDLDFDIASRAPARNGHARLATVAHYDFAAQLLELRDIQLAATLHGERLPAENTELDLRARATLKLAERHYAINDIKIAAKLSGGKLPAQPVTVDLAAQVELDLHAQRLKAEPLTLSVAGLKASGAVHGEDLSGTPHFSGALTIADFNARELMRKFGMSVPVTADPKTLTAVGAKLKFQAAADDAELTKLDIKLDQSTLSGTVALRDFAKPAIRFQLALDSIDVDRYLAPPAPQTIPAAAPPAATAAAGAEKLPLATLRKLDVDGKLRIGELKIAKLHLSDLELGFRAKEGRLRAQPLTARLYGGTYHGDLTLDARGEKLTFTTDDTLSKIEIGPLSRDWLEKDLVSGTGNVRLQLSGIAGDSAEVRRTLNGQLGFTFSDGRVNGVNLVKLIQKDYVKYLQNLVSDPATLNQTVFSNFSATAKATNGELATDDLTLKSAQLNIKGRGNINLAGDNIALRLAAKPAGQFAKQLGQFKDLTIPVNVQGTLNAPSFSVDLDEAFKQQVKGRLNAEKEKLEAELKAKEAQLRHKLDTEKAKLQQQIELRKQEAQQKLEQQQKKLEEKMQEQLQNKLKDMFK